MLKNNLVIVPFIYPWNWSADYQQQTCIALAKKNHVIAYMDRHARFFLKRKIHQYPQIKNITFFTPHYFIPLRRLKKIERLNQILCFLYLKLRYGIGKKRILWIFDPYFHFLTRLGGFTSVYDCVDYHWSRNKKETSQIRKTEKELIKNSTYFFVNSHTLNKLQVPLRKPNMVVPLGFDLKAFENSKKTNFLMVPSNNLIGYIGAINYRLDYELLFQLSRQNPKLTFLFFGPIQIEKNKIDEETEENIRSLFSFKNVIYGGQVQREYIPQIIKHFDICMIPYNVSFYLNRYSYPMKLFEYFYMGKPVVSTPIEELRRFPKYVKIGKNVSEWETHIRNLLSKPWPKKYKEEQRKLAEENSWERKIDNISQILNSKIF